MRITSTSNPRVKAAVKLRLRRERDAQGLIVVDGLREIDRALSGGVDCVEAFVCPNLVEQHAGDDVAARLNATGAEVYKVTEAVFERLAYGARREGILLIAKRPATELESIAVPAGAVVAVLVGIEKPGNVGAILRSADAAGVSAVLLADTKTDAFNPNAIRASLGTVFHVPLAAAKADTVRTWLAAHDFNMFAARVDAELDYTSAPLGQNAAIVLGSEAEGLPDAWRGDDITPIRLPMHGIADSLNVSATASVLFYESLRQRAKGERP